MSNEFYMTGSLPLPAGRQGWGWIFELVSPSPQSSPAGGEEVFST
jgi:hypothetical protein